MAEITERQILQAIEVLRKKYANGLLSRKEFLRLVAELESAQQWTRAGKAMHRLPREVIPELNEALKKRTGTYPELWETKKGGLRTRKMGTVDPARSAAAREQFFERWMRRQNLKPMLKIARTTGMLTGGIPALLAGYAAGEYPAEQEISEELEKIKGQEDESRRRATERAWLMNLFGLLQEDLSPEEKEEVLKEIDSLLVKADGID